MVQRRPLQCGICGNLATLARQVTSTGENVHACACTCAFMCRNTSSLEHGHSDRFCVGFEELNNRMLHSTKPILAGSKQASGPLQPAMWYSHFSAEIVTKATFTVSPLQAVRDSKSSGRAEGRLPWPIQPIHRCKPVVHANAIIP